MYSTLGDKATLFQNLAVQYFSEQCLITYHNISGLNYDFYQYEFNRNRQYAIPVVHGWFLDRFQNDVFLSHTIVWIKLFWETIFY